MIERLGVDIETNMRLGKDFTLQGLRDEGYEAVFVGIGAPLGTKLGIPGEEAEGVADALRFSSANITSAARRPSQERRRHRRGNAAIDAAPHGRCGSGPRRSRSSIAARGSRCRPMRKRWDEAEHEGVRLATLVAPLEIVSKNGKVTGVKCRNMVLGEFDRSGRRRPVGSTEGEFVVPADQVIAGIGQTLSVENVFNGLQLKLGKSGYIAADPVTGQTSVPWGLCGRGRSVGAVVGGWGPLRQARKPRSVSTST